MMHSTRPSRLAQPNRALFVPRKQASLIHPRPTVAAFVGSTIWQVRALSALQDYPHPFLPHCVDSFLEAHPELSTGQMASNNAHERSAQRGGGDDCSGDSFCSASMSRTFLVLRYMAGADLEQFLAERGGRYALLCYSPFAARLLRTAAEC